MFWKSYFYVENGAKESTNPLSFSKESAFGPVISNGAKDILNDLPFIAPFSGFALEDKNNEDLESSIWTDGPCGCWNTTEGGSDMEVECKCTGPNMTEVVSTLPSDVYRMYVKLFIINYSFFLPSTINSEGGFFSNLFLLQF